MWYMYIMMIFYITAFVFAIFYAAEGGSGYWDARRKRIAIENGGIVRIGYSHRQLSLEDAILNEKKALRKILIVIVGILVAPSLWLPAIIASVLYGIYYVSKAFLQTLRLKPNSPSDDIFDKTPSANRKINV